MSKILMYGKSMIANCHFLSSGALALGLLLSPLATLPIHAGQRPNGQAFFNHPPILLRSATSSPARNTAADYQFTIKVPEDAGEPLGAVTIIQRENAEMITFDTNQSSAFKGDSLAGGPDLPLSSIGGTQPDNPSEVTVMFNPPVQPGSTVTVRVRALENPLEGGAYLFGVTAFPAGMNSMGQFLGYGRIHFYDTAN